MREGADLLIVTFGNGVHMSLRVSASLAQRGIEARVLDLRWLAPFPASDVARHARATGRVLVVDETRFTGGVGEGILAGLADEGVTVAPDGGAARPSGVLPMSARLGCALAITWTKPYRVENMSVTSAFSLGFLHINWSGDWCKKCMPDDEACGVPA